MTGFTVWFTGLSGSGKSTLSKHLNDLLERRGYKVELLDGDEIRENLSQGLNFSREHRDINVRRIGYVCHLLSRNGIVAIAAAIAPYRKIREENRCRIGRYVEVYAKCPLEELKRRDTKGLYERALSGEIKNFTGVSDPYEEPLDADVICHTASERLDESLQKIINCLAEKEYIEHFDVIGCTFPKLKKLKAVICTDKDETVTEITKADR